jgi:Flp pilus assembly protein protease CpaA|tara:strand:+ start:224 stop:1102 length:879 start_codon:yes stop_codon:yes gene_type:complete
MDILILSLVLIYLIIASISDIITKEIPDFLNYSFIGIGIFIYALKTIISNNNFFLLSSLITVGSFFILGLLMYYSKQWGGGDSKLLMGVGALLPLYPSLIINNFQLKNSTFLGIDLFLNILIVGAIYTLIYAVYLIIKNKNQFFKKFKEIYSEKKIKLFEHSVWTLIIIINIISFFLSKNNYQRITMLIFSLILLFLIYLIIALKSIENISMYKKISTKKLREGDYITKELKHNNKIIFKPTIHGINKKDIPIIQKYFKQIEIKEGIAFAPVFLISMIITLLKGNIILYFLP